jgi:hypothetical protein
MLKERLTRDSVDALKSKDQERLDVLRFLIAEVHNAEIEIKRNGAELSDEDVLKVLQSEAKKRRESITLYEEGGRAELVAQEKKQLEIILSYLPQELTAEEITTIATRLNNGTNTFPELMKAVVVETKGRANGKLVSEIVKKLVDGQ